MTNMTKLELGLLKKFKEKSAINRYEYTTVLHLEKLGLISIDRMYTNNINDVTIFYAKTTKTGLSVLEYRTWYMKIPIIRKLFK